jgi:hypothetical protein
LSLADDVAALLGYCRTVLGRPESWVAPEGYRDGLALCVIDAVQSLGVRYGSVVKVLQRYRAYRRDQGSVAESDGVRELLLTFDECGGKPEVWAARIGNQHRTSTNCDAPLKAAAVRSAASGLAAQGVWTCADLRQASSSPGGLSQVKTTWRAVPGQRSGISWYYLLMLAGVESVKADRMVRRFVAASLGASVDRVSPARAATLLHRVAMELNVSERRLDHAVWLHQSGRLRPKIPRRG